VGLSRFSAAVALSGLKQRERLFEVLGGFSLGLFLVLLNRTVLGLTVVVTLPGFRLHHLWIGLALMIVSFVHPFNEYHYFLLSFGFVIAADDFIAHAQQGFIPFW
jgi:hypothetical protein